MGQNVKWKAYWDPPVKVQQAETVLTVEEMMDLIEDKLQLKAKKALFLGREPRRQVHKVEKEVEKKISFHEPQVPGSKPVSPWGVTILK